MGNLYEDFAGTIEHAAIIVGATSGNQEIVAGVTSRRIRVLGYRLSAETAVNVQWRSGTTGTTLAGTMYLSDKGEVGEPTSALPCFEIPTGLGLYLNLSAANSVGGYVNYLTL